MRKSGENRAENNKENKRQPEDTKRFAQEPPDRAHELGRGRARGLEAASDTGIQGSDDEVCQQVEQDEDDGGHQNRSCHHWKVAGQDGVVDQLAHARTGKDDFREDRRGQHLPDAHAEQRDGGQDRDGQRIAIGNNPVRQAEGTGGADVAGFQHFEHGGAHHPGYIADPAQTDGQRGQNEVDELIAEVAGSPAPIAGSQRRVTEKIKSA